MTSHIIPHPTGRLDFGRLEKMRAPGIVLPAGNIILQTGRHTGPNRGFGATHIWQEHALEMRRAGFEGFDQVADFVATIVRVGTPVFYGDHHWNSQRVMTVRSQSGTTILEFRQPRNENAFWSIVTCFTGTRTHGVGIGAVR